MHYSELPFRGDVRWFPNGLSETAGNLCISLSCYKMGTTSTGGFSSQVAKRTDLMNQSSVGVLISSPVLGSPFASCTPLLNSVFSVREDTSIGFCLAERHIHLRAHLRIENEVTET
jgi:hypothetical protein